ncbi:hypothetical protein KM043_017166 [Ampulex compressa]|nr:hypothetical protein KM043_017166 [Ampulex compressa]
MAKGSNNLSGRRSSSHNTKPYDANNSFVKKVATKVTDFIPQRSWISKWFNSSQGNGDVSNDADNVEEVELEEDVQQPPPSKRPRIRMDVTHPPGTFSIQPRAKTLSNKADTPKEYLVNDEMVDDFLEPMAAGPSGMGRLISSTPATGSDIRTLAPQRSELNTLVSATNNGTVNGTDDNSESSESTSGCSSLIPQTNRQEAPSNVSYNSPFTNRKRFIDDKLTFTNHLQSPRSLFLDSNSRDTLSSRRPSFNASVMTNTLDRASPLSSPFYSGNITFGGANAAGLYKRSRTLFNDTNELQLKVPRRTNIQVKPSNATGIDSSGMSQTAKKILEALEHFSSPITDAKKIPLKSTNNTVSAMASKKRAREESVCPTARVGLRHMTRELTVPTVPDILKLRRRQKLQNTTVAARKIVSARSEPPPSQEYRLRTETDENSKYQGKLRAKSKANLDEEDTVEVVNLPTIPLPISSLPNFDFTVPQTPLAEDKSIITKQDTFTFASPIKVPKMTKVLKSINNFTFSSPINAEDNRQSFSAPRLKEKIKNEGDGPSTSELKSGSVMDVLCSKSNSKESETSKQEKFSLESENNTVANKGSMDAANDGPSVWECAECLIKNNNTETQCVACKALKPSCKDTKVSQPLSMSTNTTETKPVVNDCFGSQFKLSSNQWECSECYIRNKQAELKCVACNALKPKAKSEDQAATPNVAKEAKSDLMEKFKPAEGSWECPGCMLRNSVTATSCVCCHAPNTNSKLGAKKNKNANENTTSTSDQSATVSGMKDASSKPNLATSEILEKFKSKDSWECPSCMVRNNSSVDSCPCCNTAKPTTTAKPATKTESASSNGFGDKFKKPEGSWSCDSCMVQNQAKDTTCVACSAIKPGSKTAETPSVNTGSTLQFSFGIPANSGGFKFGIDKADSQPKSDGISSMNGFKFGEIQQTGQVPHFTFGIPTEDKKVVSETSKSTDTVPQISQPAEIGTGIQTKSDTIIKFSGDQAMNKDEKTVAPIFAPIVPNSKSTTVVTDKYSSGVQGSAPSTSGFMFTALKPETKSITELDKTQAVSSSLKSTVEIPTPKVEVAAPVAATSTNASLSTLIAQANTQANNTNTTFSFGAINTTTAVTNSASTNIGATCLPVSTQSSFAYTDAETMPLPSTLQSFGDPTAVSNPGSGLAPTFRFGENKSDKESKQPATLTSSAATTSIFSSIPNATSFFGNNEGKPTAFVAKFNSKPVSFGATPAKSPAFAMSENKTSGFGNTENKVSSFGSTENKVSSFGNAENKVSTFGNTENKVPSFESTENKVPSFASTENKVPSFGSTENKLPSFGSSDNKAPLFGTNETKMPIFGATEKPTPVFNAPTPASAALPAVTPAPTPAPAFGAVSATPSPFGSSSIPVFGNTSSSSFCAGPTPSIFSVTKPNETNTPNPNLFSFGTAPVQPVAQPASGFNYPGNTNSAVSSPKQLFTFGSTSNAPQTNNTLFGGSTFNSVANNTPSFTFNAPKPETSAFGQTPVATPMFGAPQATAQSQTTPSFSSAPASNAGFIFGSTAPATSSGGFNFRSMAPESTPSTAYNFNPPSTTPTFDPNTRPSFNFTGGSTPAFNATPQPTMPRKIKKAQTNLLKWESTLVKKPNEHCIRAIGENLWEIDTPSGVGTVQNLIGKRSVFDGNL